MPCRWVPQKRNRMFPHPLVLTRPGFWFERGKCGNMGSPCLDKLVIRKEIILRSNNPWGHHHIYTQPDISARPAWWLDKLVINHPYHFMTTKGCPRVRRLTTNRRPLCICCNCQLQPLPRNRCLANHHSDPRPPLLSKHGSPVFPHFFGTIVFVPPPPPVMATGKSQINTVPTPTAAWTRP